MTGFKGERGVITDSEPGSDEHAGSVERSVRADIKKLGPLTTGVRSTLAEMAYAIAAAYDQARMSDAPPTQLATLNKELRQTLLEVTRTADDNRRRDALADFLAQAVAPDVGDTEEP